MGGQEGGIRLIMGGQTCAGVRFFLGKHVLRSAHCERVSASRFFFLGGGQTCARSAHSERVSAMPILGGVQGPALGPLAGCRGRAPAGGPGGGAPGRFWIYAFQSPINCCTLKVILVTKIILTVLHILIGTP